MPAARTCVWVSDSLAASRMAALYAACSGGSLGAWAFRYPVPWRSPTPSPHCRCSLASAIAPKLYHHALLRDVTRCVNSHARDDNIYDEVDWSGRALRQRGW